MNDKIKNLKAWQILDSRGNPTVTASVELESGIKGFASVPSGASVGTKEALELRDKDNPAYLGRGVLNAIENLNGEISHALIGRNPFNQENIDNILIELDGTENKSRLGANAILAASLAVARCASNAIKLPLYKYLGGINALILPVPMVNILNGGAHSDNPLDFQEFMITPTGACNFESALQICAEIFHSLKIVLKEKGLSSAIGDEGGYAPYIKSNREALDLIMEGIIKAGYSTDEVKICLDVASSEFYKDGKYLIKSENLELTNVEMAEYLKKLVEDYPIISIEDGMAEADYDGWRILTDLLGDDCLLVGDDLFVTNGKLLYEGIRENIANAVLIKPNQIGTLTETLKTIQIANFGGYKTIISHRSGETNDTFIADLAVGVNSKLIKTGSISRGERIIKYNRLLEIERELNFENQITECDRAVYLGLLAYKKGLLKNFSCKNGCSRRN